MSQSRSNSPLLWLLFCSSGCAALIYEIVWFQLLQFVIGASGISIGLLLATFMGGMCLGSVGFARLVPSRWHPLVVYALLEFGIGACGLALLFLLPVAGRVYVLCGPGFSAFLGRGLLCGLALLPPTVLMGATLPTISRWLDSTPAGLSYLGLLYAGNTAGAVLGCLAAGFYFLRVHDLVVTTLVAVGLNLWVGVTALYLAGAVPKRAPVPESDLAAERSLGGSSVYWVVALSGFCALGGEVVWTRLLSLILGATVYAFSMILAVFLGGLALGSWAGASLARSTKRPGFALAASQLLLALAIAWTAFMLADSVPYWPVNPSLSRSLWLTLQIDLVRCGWAIFPATCLFGASFPLALAAAVPPGEDQARFVGRLYAANTLGAVLGALLASLVLLPRVGSQNLQRLLIATSGFSGLLMLIACRNNGCVGAVRQYSGFQEPIGGRNPAPPPTLSPSEGEREDSLASSLVKAKKPLGSVLFATAATVTVILLFCTVPRLPWALVAYGRYLPVKTELGKVLFLGEGMNASVAVTELSTGVRNFHISGKVEASTDPRDMRLQRMLGHIPGLIHPQPRSVLVVGCGAGVTAGSFVPYPQVEKILICELEPLIPRVVAQYFSQENNDVVRDRRTQVVYDDARHFILSTREKFDVITSDPIHPWVKGAATLYTKEYFELCKGHLNPGGLVTQWVPLYESNLPVVRSELATFFEVFPNGTIWSNDENGEGYDVVLLGSAEPLTIDLQQVQDRLAHEDYHAVLQSLREVGFRSSYSLFATYAGQAGDLKPWLQHAQINRDRNLRLQYLAGLGVNYNEQDLILSDLLLYRRFPEELFTGSNVWKQTLKSTIEKAAPKK